MKRRALYFVNPGEIEVREEIVPPPGPGEAVVKTRLSAISAGTEMLFYRGEFPKDMPLDKSLPTLQGPSKYPLKYGYACVGQIVAVGDNVPLHWNEQWVFAFNPHESFFTAAVESLVPLPAHTPPERAIFLPNMETAVTFLLDGKPLIGEHVLVIGQGVVGLLATALLAQFPLASLVTLDKHLKRREISLLLGAQSSLEPSSSALQAILQEVQPAGADLIFELSGSPQALDTAIASTRFSGRLVIGSWYGEKRYPINLGGHFHRNRLQLISSQVSTLAPELSMRWNKGRRIETAWHMLNEIKPERLITHTYPIIHADAAYQLLDCHPEETIQVIFTYD